MTLPNFLGIGAAKAGTTSLYYYLREHPQVFMSPVKEANFFAYDGQDEPRFRHKTREHYESLFTGARQETAIGEISPLYLYSPIAATRIREAVPGARLIACLRNPADRAWSGYLMQIRQGDERRPLDECFRRGDIYVEVGFYHAQIKRYLDVFDPQQIEIVLFEELKTDPLAVMQRIYHFLDVDSSFEPDVARKHNKGVYPKSFLLNHLLLSSRLSKALRGRLPPRLRQLGERLLGAVSAPAPEFPPELRQRLLALYREDIDRLEELIGLDLDVWRV